MTMPEGAKNITKSQQAGGKDWVAGVQKSAYVWRSLFKMFSFVLIWTFKDSIMLFITLQHEAG